MRTSKTRGRPSPEKAYAALRAYIAGDDVAMIDSTTAESMLASDGMRNVVASMARINERTRLFSEAICDRALQDISNHQLRYLSSLAKSVIGEAGGDPRTAVKVWIRDASSVAQDPPPTESVADVRVYIDGAELDRIASLRGKDRDELTKSERRELLNLLDEQTLRGCDVFRCVGRVAFDAYSDVQAKLLKALVLALDKKNGER